MTDIARSTTTSCQARRLRLARPPASSMKPIPTTSNAATVASEMVPGRMSASRCRRRDSFGVTAAATSRMPMARQTAPTVRGIHGRSGDTRPRTPSVTTDIAQ